VGAGGVFGTVEDGSGHLGVGPAGGDAVGVDAVGGELGGERLGEGDDGALGGGVVGVASLATLAGGGGDEDDVSASGLERDTAGGGVGIAFRAGAGEHVGGGGVDEAEDTRDIGGNRAMPLGGGHASDGGGDRRPDAVVGDEDVEISEGCESAGDEGFAVLGGGEGLLDGEAEGWAAERGGEGFGLRGGLLIAEGDTGSGLAEEADGGGADAARASGDEGGAAGKGNSYAGSWGGLGGHG